MMKPDKKFIYGVFAMNLSSLLTKEIQKNSKMLVVTGVGTFLLILLRRNGTASMFLSTVSDIALAVAVFLITRYLVIVVCCRKESDNLEILGQYADNMEIRRSQREEWMKNLQKCTKATFAFVVACIAFFILSMLGTKYTHMWDYVKIIRLFTYILAFFSAYLLGTQYVRRMLSEHAGDTEEK